MDIIIVAALVMLAVIIITETVCLFRREPKITAEELFAAVIPVFPYDNDFAVKLEYLNEKISCGSFRAETIILIDYGADIEQLEVCREFCRNNSAAVMTDPDGLEKILSKTFAIRYKI
jgi:hypothetical protein